MLEILVSKELYSLTKDFGDEGGGEFFDLVRRFFGGKHEPFCFGFLPLHHFDFEGMRAVAERLDVVPVRNDTNAGHVIKPQDRKGRPAETVFDFIENGVDLFEGGHFTQAMVEFESEAFVVDIAFGKLCRKGEVDFGFDERDFFAILQRVDRFFEQLAVEMEADRTDMSRLFGA